MKSERGRTMSCSGRGRPLRDGASPLNSVLGRHREVSVLRNRAMILLITNVAAATALIASAAQAHPDYEHTEVVREPDGRVWFLVLHYTDGIIFGDPVWLIVRDAGGTTIAETETAKDICVWGCSIGRCFVFRYAHDQPFLPANVWRFSRGQLQPRNSLGLRLFGVVVPLLDDPVGYGVGVCLFFAPFGVHALMGRISRQMVRTLSRLCLWLVAVPCLLLWLYFTLVGGVSTVLMLGLVSMFGAAWAVWKMKRPNNELQLTSGERMVGAARS
jgi:hypothetical protein